jgi:hypothetical protein
MWAFINTFIKSVMFDLSALGINTDSPKISRNSNIPVPVRHSTFKLFCYV